MAGAVLSSSSLCCYASIRDIRIPHPSKLASSSRQFSTAFATGSPLSIRTPIYRRKAAGLNSTSVSVRCEQSTKEEGNGLDVWLGRLAMVGFAAAISVEVATGKGLLENFGLTDPLPTVALAVTALVGVLTAVFIFQSASKN
ncbi:stress enhanced protein 1, chloroplastic-like isoform X1 [Salvia hispanica]|uniref:stress enhanced protein 1, chloroplastic-like isoform X1 n=1 Tax=Salvia hispanica TaxID=49212 RepID=UPI002009CEF6|nr:stress enhanced protein 1, chloroplastic-like isoform X1 [Salvia hispanica]